MATKVVSIISRMNVGGPAVLLSELISNLPPELISHTLITGVCLNNEIDYLEAHPLDSEVIYIADIKRSVLPTNDIKSFFKLVKVLRELSPDVIHTHTSKAGVLGRIAGVIAAPKARIIHTYHGHLLYGYFGKSKVRAVVLIEKFLSLFSDNLVAVTKQVKDDLIVAGVGRKSNWSIIRPGLAEPKRLSRPDALKQLGLSHDKRIVAWIGRFTDIKNPIAALTAMGQVGESNPSIHLVMAGDGELFEVCEQLSREHNLPVTFLGWTSEIGPLLDASELLLMSSNNEGMPVVIVEAASRSIPTLSTNVGGVGEFIEDEKTGYLVNSPDLIAESLIAIFSHQDLLDDVSANARKLYEADFNKAKYLENHLALYKAK